MARKKYFEVDLPILKRKVELLAESEDSLKGKSIKLDLAREIKGKNFEIIYKIDQEGAAKPHKLHVYKYFLRRMMRKSIDYVEDSFQIECGDANLRVKPFLITSKKVSRNVRKALRNKAREEIENYIGDKKFEEVISSLLSNDFQKDLSLALKKIYPLTLCEIKEIYVESSGGESKEEKEAKKKVKEE